MNSIADTVIIVAIAAIILGILGFIGLATYLAIEIFA